MLSKAQREPKIHPPARCLFPLPLHLVFLPAAFHPVTWGNFSTPVVAPVAQHGHLPFRLSSLGPHLLRVQPSRASMLAWLTWKTVAPPVFHP